MFVLAIGLIAFYLAVICLLACFQPPREDGQQTLFAEESVTTSLRSNLKSR